MKRIALMIAGLLLPLSEAMAENWRFNARVGLAQGDTSASKLDSQLADAGLNATASSEKDGRLTWQLNFGYQFTPSWGLELGYLDLGEVKTSFSGDAADINNFLITARDIHPQTAQGWQLQGNYRHPIDPRSRLVLMAGMLDWRSSYTLSAANASRKVKADGQDATWGLGVEVETDRDDMLLGVHFNRYSIDGEDISTLNVGLSFRF